MQVTADFLEQLLQPSTSELSFAHTREEGVPATTQLKALKLTNVSKLPLTDMLRCTVPFIVDVTELALGARPLRHLQKLQSYRSDLVRAPPSGSSDLWATFHS